MCNPSMVTGILAYRHQFHTARAKGFCDYSMSCLMNRNCPYEINISIRHTFRCAKHHPHARTENIFFGDPVPAIKACVNTGFIDYVFNVRAGTAFQNRCNFIYVNVAYDLLLVQEIFNQFFRFFPCQGLHFNYFVESAGTQQGIRHTVLIICRSDNKNVFVFTFIDTGLYSNILICITMIHVFVGKLVQIIKEYYGCFFFLCFIKYLSDSIDERPVRFVLPDSKALTSAFFNKAVSQQCFSQSRITVQ